MTNLEQAMPVISTLGEVASIESSWYAVQTMPRHEKKVSGELEAKQI